MRVDSNQEGESPRADLDGEETRPTEDPESKVPASLTPAPPVRGRLREWIESIAFTVVFVLVFTSFVAQATQVPTESMKPTILVGDHFFLDKVAFPANYPSFVRPYLPERSIERGDIVAFRVPTQSRIPFVKRLIGLPGDVVEIKNKIVFVNNIPIAEPYKIHVDETVYGDEPWTPHRLRIRDNYGPVVLGQDDYFAMGDNRDNSNDSRYWGFVERENIIGKPLFIYWSYQGSPYVPGRRSLTDRARGYLSVAFNFFRRTRWFRMGMVVG